MGKEISLVGPSWRTSGHQQCTEICSIGVHKAFTTEINFSPHSSFENRESSDTNSFQCNITISELHVGITKWKEKKRTLLSHARMYKSSIAEKLQPWLFFFLKPTVTRPIQSLASVTANKCLLVVVTNRSVFLRGHGWKLRTAAIWVNLRKGYRLLTITLRGPAWRTFLENIQLATRSLSLILVFLSGACSPNRESLPVRVRTSFIKVSTWVHN